MLKWLIAWADRVAAKLLNDSSMRLFSAQPIAPNYLTVVVLMAVALALRLAMAPVQAGLQYVTFFPAITLAAFLGGMRAGLVATAIGMTLATVIFTPPYYSLSWAVVHKSLWSNLVFLVDGCIVSLVIDAMHRYRRRYQAELVGAQRASTQLAELNQQLRIAAVAFESIEAIMIADAEARIVQVNSAFERYSGYTAAEVVGQNPRMLASGRHDRAFYQAMWDTLLDTGTWSGEIWDRHKSGHIYPKQMTITAIRNEAGDTTHYVSIFTDITERKRAEEAIHNLAFYDPLTGLPNRRLLADRMGTALATAVRERHWGAVLCLDMDRFKLLNDSLGHHHGDLFLIAIAQRLRGLVRKTDTVARLGGDEFVLLVSNISGDAGEASVKVAHLADKVREALAQPYQLDHYTHHSTASIGVCLYGGPDVQVDELLQRADKAMYESKESGRNRVRFFDPQLQAAVRAHEVLEAELRQAIAAQQFSLFYQLKVNAQGQPLAAEAMVRWHHPTRGLLLPEHFMHVAEGSPMLPLIGQWALDTACQQLAAWQGHPQAAGLALAVNIHPQQFAQPDFMELLSDMLRAHGAPPGKLRLNLVEAAVLTDVEGSLRRMRELRETMGVHLVLDHFGTGYSSLSALQRLPLDKVKIDASLVARVLDDPESAAMIRVLVGVARQFHLQVLANGVDSAAQFQVLVEAGCDAFQGSLFGPPLAVDAFNLMLAHGRHKAAGLSAITPAG
ncbi:MAG: EAL domain-containing protein [Burkholderiales bacterium]|nr:EAL domain-containing protein [Burkholderiales bacterium]